MLIEIICNLVLTQGTPIYTIPLPEVPQESTIAQPAEGNAIIMTIMGQIIKLDINTGNKIWIRDLGSFASAPLVGNSGRILGASGGRNRKIKCFNYEGKQLWEREKPNVVGLALNDELAVILQLDGKLIVVNAFDGKDIWEKKLKTPVTVLPILTADAVVATDGEGMVLYLDKTDGNEKRNVNIGSTLLRVAMDSSGKLACLSESGLLTVWDNTGENIWRVEGINSPADMVLAGNHLIVSNAFGEITAYNIGNGNLLWNVSLGEPQASWLFYDAKTRTILMGGSEGTVKIWDEEDGKETSAIKTPKRATAVVRIGEMVIVGGMDKKLRGYKLE